MANSVKASIAGLNELNRKVRLLRQTMDGAPVTKLLREAGRPIQQQARSNARRGPSGLLQRSIVLFAGRKAAKFGALVVVRAKWRGTGAVFEEWGTGERVFNVMRIPLSKLGAIGRRKVAKVGGAFGFLFTRKAKPMKGTRFFENAVEQKMPRASQVIEQGLRKMIGESIR